MIVSFLFELFFFFFFNQEKVCRPKKQQVMEAGSQIIKAKFILICRNDCVCKSDLTSAVTSSSKPKYKMLAECKYNEIESESHIKNQPRA